MVTPLKGKGHATPWDTMLAPVLVVSQYTKVSRYATCLMSLNAPLWHILPSLGHELRPSTRYMTDSLRRCECEEYRRRSTSTKRFFRV
jgi:hypothetical protein